MPLTTKLSIDLFYCEKNFKQLNSLVIRASNIQEKKNSLHSVKWKKELPKILNIDGCLSLVLALKQVFTIKKQILPSTFVLFLVKLRFSHLINDLVTEGVTLGRSTSNQRIIGLLPALPAHVLASLWAIYCTCQLQVGAMYGSRTAMNVQMFVHMVNGTVALWVSLKIKKKHYILEV